MALYLGNERVRIRLDGRPYCLRALPTNPPSNVEVLATFNGGLLADSKGVYLTIKEDTSKEV